MASRLAARRIWLASRRWFDCIWFSTVEYVAFGWNSSELDPDLCARMQAAWSAEEYLQICPSDDTAYADLLAEARFRKQDYGDAERALTQALQLRSSAVHFHKRALVRLEQVQQCYSAMEHGTELSNEKEEPPLDATQDLPQPSTFDRRATLLQAALEDCRMAVKVLFACSVVGFFVIRTHCWFFSLSL